VLDETNCELTKIPVIFSCQKYRRIRRDRKWDGDNNEFSNRVSDSLSNSEGTANSKTRFRGLKSIS
jgi:hypothetical protein